MQLPGDDNGNVLVEHLVEARLTRCSPVYIIPLSLLFRKLSVFDRDPSFLFEKEHEFKLVTHEKFNDLIAVCDTD